MSVAEKGAIIGGTGFYRLGGGQFRELTVETPYGLATVFVGEGDLANVVFLPRHGPKHQLPPHRINYRANIKALEQMGVKRILAVATVAERGIAVQPEGLYGCTEGPRLETAAEVALMARWGVDVIGMTGVPEAVLARELGLCYASVALVVNYGAGVMSGAVNLDAEGRVARAQAGEPLLSLMIEVLTDDRPFPPCSCAESLIVVKRLANQN